MVSHSIVMWGKRGQLELVV